MSDKKRRPVIEKLITPALRSEEGSTSPTTPFEFKVLSPRGFINHDMGGIGLGIVVALEKSSKSIAVSRSSNVGDWEMGDETGSDDEEEYTIVTCRKVDKSFTKVYHGGREIESREQPSIFDISSSRFGYDDMKVCQPSGFLNSCYLCSKRLHGKDIYMYRGEKGFCSPECRSRQITMDERPEKYCSSQASGTSCKTFTTGIFAI